MPLFDVRYFMQGNFQTFALQPFSSRNWVSKQLSEFTIERHLNAQKCCFCAFYYLIKTFFKVQLITVVRLEESQRRTFWLFSSVFTIIFCFENYQKIEFNKLNLLKLSRWLYFLMFRISSKPNKNVLRWITNGSIGKNV